VSARRPSQRFTTGLIVGFFAAGIAYAVGAGLLWSVLVGLAGTAIAAALT
jgi:uncharacterized membrane protein YeaQ/YmgE (transglycosylase-associated protein family)